MKYSSTSRTMELEDTTYGELMMQLALNGFAASKVVSACVQRHDDALREWIVMADNSRRGQALQAVLKHVFDEAKKAGVQNASAEVSGSSCFQACKRLDIEFCLASSASQLSCIIRGVLAFK